MNPSHISHHPCAPAGETGYGGGESGSTGKIAQARENIARSARDTAQQLKSAATDTATRAREEAERLARERKEQAANRIGGYSSAIHESARSLEEQDPNIAHYTHRAADQLQQVADYVRNVDFTTIRQDASDIARRHPTAFFGGMFVFGLVVGNLLKARRTSAYDQSRGGYETGDTSGGWAQSEVTREYKSLDELPTPAATPSSGAPGI